MKPIVLAGFCRTPVGNFGGAFREMNSTQLGVVVAREALQRVGIEPRDLDEVVFSSGGHPTKEANLGRQVSLFASFPYEIPAFSVQRNCAGGLQAVTSAAQAIRAGDGEVILAGGAENMSNAPYEVYGARWGLRLRHAAFEDSLWTGLTDPYTGLIMGLTAENLAERYGITREEQDTWAVESHRKAFTAARMGRFKDEIVPVEVPKRRGPAEVVKQDESPVAGLSLERLALAEPVFKKDGTVTAGNSCPINDAASACVVASEEAASRLDIKPMAYLRSWAYAGCDPSIMGIGPVHSTRKALEKAGLKLEDIDLMEINEAFAAQVIACQREMGFDVDRINVNGGGIALGHPIGATGLRLLTTLAHEMARRGARYGLATLCVGGGMGGSVILERRE
ncbi:MAG: thiolase family protein [Bacillota bacterium]